MLWAARIVPPMPQALVSMIVTRRSAPVRSRGCARARRTSTERSTRITRRLKERTIDRMAGGRILRTPSLDSRPASFRQARRVPCQTRVRCGRPPCTARSSSSERWARGRRCSGSSSTATTTSRSRARPASCAPTTRTSSSRSSGPGATGPSGWAGAGRSSTRSSARFYDRIFMRNVEKPGQAALGRQDAVPHVARRRHGAAVPRGGVHRHRPPPGRLRQLEHESLGPHGRPGRVPLPPLQPRDRPPGGAGRRPLRHRPLRGPGAAARGAPARAARLARRAVVAERARAPHGAGRPRRQAQGRGAQPRRRPDRHVADRQVGQDDERGAASGAAPAARRARRSSSATTSTTRRGSRRSARAR